MLSQSQSFFQAKLVTNLFANLILVTLGMGGGKFLERQRVKKPNQPRYGTELSVYYQANDMFVGNTVELNRFKFVIIDADEYAFRYMEQHSSEVKQHILL